MSKSFSWQSYIYTPYLPSSLASCRRMLIKRNKGQSGCRAVSPSLIYPSLIGTQALVAFGHSHLEGFLFTRTLVVYDASIQGLSYHWSAFIPTLVARSFLFFTFTFSWHRAIVQGVPFLLVYGLGNQFWTHVAGCWLPAAP